MTFKAHLGKVNLILVIALLAALMLPAMSVATGEAIAFYDSYEAGTAETIHSDNAPVAIACNCGDPGGGGTGGGCC